MEQAGSVLKKQIRHASALSLLLGFSHMLFIHSSLRQAQRTGGVLRHRER